ncbi:MAG: RNA-binding protein [Deltaproteobacteria bacterium]|nr:RNA-binding protein [Deltaproteobacteria bacterium]
MNIYVGNLPYSTDEEGLRQMFSQYGEVASTSVIIDRATGRSRGFGFVEMPNDDEAREAIETMHGAELAGRALVANEARPREERPSNGGGGSRDSRGPRRNNFR